MIPKAPVLNLVGTTHSATRRALNSSLSNSFFRQLKTIDDEERPGSDPDSSQSVLGHSSLQHPVKQTTLGGDER